MPRIPSVPPGAPLPWLSWSYSLILAAALLGIAATVVATRLDGEDSDPPDGTVVAEPTVGQTATAANSTTASATTGSADSATSAPATPGTPTSQATPNATPEATPSPADRIEGVISNDNGDPIKGAIISDGTNIAVTGADGLFEIDAQGEVLTVIASGYHLWESRIEAGDDPLLVTLELQPVRALYFNPNMSGSEEDIQRFIDMIGTTAANAVVIDIKEEIIYYDSKVDLFVEAGTVRPVMDLEALIARFEAEGIYTIARLVVFKDGLVAQHDPSLAVLNNQTGDLWRDDNGVAWVNPMVHELWDANIDLAVEAVGFGFDEIQYDYVRFPTDGDFSTMDFGIDNTQENREKAINGFLERSQERLAPMGVRTSADVFGFTLIVDDDLGIGQNFPLVAQHVDYISPMIYPSHWPNGSLAVDGHPNDFPYESTAISMRRAGEKLDGDMLRVRPWLQDFSFPGLTPYGDAEVRAQIEAAEEYGVSGWMLWDPNNNYHPGGFPSEPVSDGTSTPAIPPASPAASPTSTNRNRDRRLSSTK